MMFNREATIWGTHYNPAHDVLRVHMQVDQLEEPVEMMSIEVAPTAKVEAIHVIWERINASALFTTSNE